MIHLEVCLKAAVALEKWPGPIVAPRGSGHRYGGPTWAQQPQAHGAGADQDGAGRSWGASASGSRPLGLGGFASVWLRGPGCGGSLGPASRVLGGDGPRRAEARWSFLQPALRVRPWAGARRPIILTHGPGAWWGPLGSHLGPRNQTVLGAQPERTAGLKAGAGGGSEGRGQPGPGAGWDTSARAPPGQLPPAADRWTDGAASGGSPTAT